MEIVIGDYSYTYEDEDMPSKGYELLELCLKLQQLLSNMYGYQVLYMYNITYMS
jgi:hypothetical protein